MTWIGEHTRHRVLAKAPSPSQTFHKSKFVIARRDSSTVSVHWSERGKATPRTGHFACRASVSDAKPGVSQKRPTSLSL